MERVIKCETKDRPGLLSFKDVLLDVCEQRNDKWGREVEIRINGAHSDLPAADAQYHKKCYDAFMVIPKYTDLSTHYGVVDDEALKKVIDFMYANQLKVHGLLLNYLQKTQILIKPLYCPYF